MSSAGDVVEKLHSVVDVFKAYMSNHIYLIILFLCEDLDLLYWDIYFFSLHSSVSIIKVTHRWLFGTALLEMQS